MCINNDVLLNLHWVFISTINSFLKTFEKTGIDSFLCVCVPITRLHARDRKVSWFSWSLSLGSSWFRREAAFIEIPASQALAKAFHELSHLILTMCIWCWYFYHLYFKVKESKLSCIWDHIVSKWGLNQKKCLILESDISPCCSLIGTYVSLAC